MEEYMAMYGTNIDMLFKTHYRLASAGDIQELRNVVLNGYNNFASSNRIMRDVKCKVYHDSMHKAAASSTFCPIEDINVITVSTITQRETETMATMTKKCLCQCGIKRIFVLGIQSAAAHLTGQKKADTY